VNPRYRATARRHRVLFALIILLCALFGLSSALGSPKLYRSNATLVFKSLDTGASQFGATPPAAQNQAMLNELLATRNFPDAVARKSQLGAYLETHTSMGSGPITLLKRVLKGQPTYDERVATALGPKRMTSLPAGSDLLGLSLEAPTPALAQSTLRVLIQQFLQERKRLQGNALSAATDQFAKARTELAQAQSDLNGYAGAHPASTAGSDPELRALSNAQLQATRQLRAAASVMNTALAAVNGGTGLPTTAGVFDNPNLPVAATTGKKRLGELTLVGAFVGALISFGLIALMSRSNRDEPPSVRPLELREASPNGSGGDPEHEPGREAVGGEAGSGEQIRRE
jgi:uncharacterized protein involved in exopolysaccharide biosynthesis